VDSKGQHGWESANKEQRSKDLARTESVTKRACNGTDNQRRRQSNNIGVGNLILRKLQVLLDAVGDKRSPGIPESVSLYFVSTASGKGNHQKHSTERSTYHERNARKKPIHEKVNTRP
jgi:hypothetical protein